MPKLLFDHTLDLLADPYRYISRQCRKRKVDGFQARLLGRRTLCLTGARAAELFYDTRYFERRGAAPEPLKATLFGKGAVQGLDAGAHRVRKSLFMSMMGPASLASLASWLELGWTQCARQWPERGRFSLYTAVQPVLARAACNWVGISVSDAMLPQCTRWLVSMYDDAASPGWRHLRARWSRHRAESWLAEVVRQARSRPGTPAQSWLMAFSLLEDERGRLLPPKVVAAELLNVLRPLVAASVFVVFAAHAMALRPQWRSRLKDDDENLLDAFVQEVRRHYPFFPAVVAQAKRSFQWEGLQIQKGQRALLDLYGTNHDNRVWHHPELFQPERFLGQSPTAYQFIPQGGGLPLEGHRCPGEAATVLVMKSAIRFLTWVDYTVPPQNLRIDLQRLPALPVGGMHIDQVHVAMHERLVQVA